MFLILIYIFHSIAKSLEIYECYYIRKYGKLPKTEVAREHNAPVVSTNVMTILNFKSTTLHAFHCCKPYTFGIQMFSWNVKLRDKIIKLHAQGWKPRNGNIFLTVSAGTEILEMYNSWKCMKCIIQPQIMYTYIRYIS